MEELTRFERARILSARSLQLALGAPPLMKPTGQSSPMELAKQEFAKKVLPLSVLRIFPNGNIERIELSQ